MPRIRRAREELVHSAPERLAEAAGAAWDGQALGLSLLDKPFRITYPELVVRPADGGEPCPEELQALFLDYLSAADGTAFSGKWLSFRELSRGQFYFHAFQGYAERPLVEAVGNDMTGLGEAAQWLAGQPIGYGDCGYAFDVLPRVRLAVVYWLGDEEFPPNASVLFDASAERYLPVDGLANLGRMLTSRLVKRYQSLGC